jgi:hypothetical protein
MPGGFKESADNADGTEVVILVSPAAEGREREPKYAE